MDNQTLESLKAAFQIAPSEELAKVIISNAIGDSTQNITPYLHCIKAPLDEALILSTALHLRARREYSEALSILDKKAPKQLRGRIDIYLSMNDEAEAKQAYIELLEQDPEQKSEELDYLLSESVNSVIEKPVNADGQLHEKPKLRIVEKPSNSGVEDLARYRGKTTSFKDVVGLERIKKQISKKIIMPFQKPSLFQRFKKKIGGGVLLYGPPGCGKTLLARATAGECKASFYNIEASDVLDMYIGESEQKLRSIFEKARSDTPCVVFFDELEALAGKREYNKGNASNIVSQFLTELDGFSQNNEGVLVLASTNVPWSIDSAFLRPGRFDRMLFVPPPDKPARVSILEHYLKGRPIDGEIDYQSIIAKTGGFSGADLENLVEMAADEAIDEMLESNSETSITNQHVMQALTECRATTQEWLTTARNYARYANDGGRYDEVLEFLKKHGK